VGRKSRVERITSETSITLSLDLDGEGKGKISTPVGFLNHMLQTLACHSGMNLEVDAQGDVDVDYHHLVEDMGIVLGEALDKGLGDKGGIERFGEALVPMDEALAQVALDLSGREHLFFSATFPAYKVGDFDTELIQEFFQGVVRGSKMTLHIRLLKGDNSHHAIEAIFKAFARALRQAVRVGEGDIPSTKGVL
jgi:imidazoleglycerol-phosphate dehydratase